MKSDNKPPVSNSSTAQMDALFRRSLHSWGKGGMLFFGVGSAALGAGVAVLGHIDQPDKLTKPRVAAAAGLFGFLGALAGYPCGRVAGYAFHRAVVPAAKFAETTIRDIFRKGP